MLSKCANPNCSEQFRYLRKGRIFHSHAASGGGAPASHQERFWLCDRCSKEMTLVKDGTRFKLVRLGTNAAALPPNVAQNALHREQPKRRTPNAFRGYE